ncbi:MAG: TIGR02678 family protein [Nocardioidaceae bacterium]
MTMTRGVERPAPQSDLIAEAEVRAAARRLLMTPLVYTGGDHDDELRLIRRHRAELTRLFAEGLGYRLVVEPGLARLFKTGTDDASRGLRRRTSGAPFTPRRYALLALTLAALTRTKSQLMVDELVAQVRSAAAEAGVDVDLDAITDRRALHAALTALCELGVLTERDGDLEHWAERSTESLLDVHRDRLAVLVAAPLGGCRSVEDVLAVTAVPSAAGGARVACRRMLAERPVLTVDELTDEQREWWLRSRNREREWFASAFGLDLELRAEGAVAIDPGGELTDRAFPAGGSARHFALLLVEGLVDRLRDTHGDTLAGTAWARVGETEARGIADDVFASWREGFKKAHREDPGALYDEALSVLEDAGLARRGESAVLVHAAAARYAARPLLTEPAASGERSLFDQEDDQP